MQVGPTHPHVRVKKRKELSTLKYCILNELVLFAQERSWQAANVKRVDSSIRCCIMHHALVHINNAVYIFYSLMFISFFLLPLQLVLYWLKKMVIPLWFRLSLKLWNTVQSWGKDTRYHKAFRITRCRFYIISSAHFGMCVVFFAGSFLVHGPARKLVCKISIIVVFLGLKGRRSKCPPWVFKWLRPLPSSPSVPHSFVRLSFYFLSSHPTQPVSLYRFSLIRFLVWWISEPKPVFVCWFPSSCTLTRLGTFPSWCLPASNCHCTDRTDVARTLPSAHADAPSFLCVCQYIAWFPSASLTSLLPLGCGFDCICAVHAVWSCWSWQLWFLSQRITSPWLPAATSVQRHPQPSDRSPHVAGALTGFHWRCRGTKPILGSRQLRVIASQKGVRAIVREQVQKPVGGCEVCSWTGIPFSVSVGDLMTE